MQTSLDTIREDLDKAQRDLTLAYIYGLPMELTLARIIHLSKKERELTESVINGTLRTNQK